MSKEKKSVVIELTDVKETIIHPLIDKLLGDKDVLLATYKIGHPQLDRPRLTVKTQRVNPETAIKKAADSLEDETLALKKEFERAVKRYKPKKVEVKKAKVAKAKKVEVKKAKAAKAKKGGKKTKKKSR